MARRSGSRKRRSTSRRSHPRKGSRKSPRRKSPRRKSAKKSRKSSRRVKKSPCAKWKKIDCGRTDASCGWSKRGCVLRRGAKAGAAYFGPVMPAKGVY
jgi:hypothetical protein